jgi:hypothetical protein
LKSHHHYQHCVMTATKKRTEFHHEDNNDAASTAVRPALSRATISAGGTSTSSFCPLHTHHQRTSTSQTALSTSAPPVQHQVSVMNEITPLALFTQPQLSSLTTACTSYISHQGNSTQHRVTTVTDSSDGATTDTDPSANPSSHGSNNSSTDLREASSQQVQQPPLPMICILKHHRHHRHHGNPAVMDTPDPACCGDRLITSCSFATPNGLSGGPASACAASQLARRHTHIDQQQMSSRSSILQAHDGPRDHMHHPVDSASHTSDHCNENVHQASSVAGNVSARGLSLFRSRRPRSVASPCSSGCRVQRLPRSTHTFAHTSLPVATTRSKTYNPHNSP